MDIDENLFATDPDLKAGFLQRVQNERNKRVLRTMPAKRKRSYSRRRSYKRRRTSPSASSIAKQMSKILRPTGPYGVVTSAQYQRYGPSRQQMIDNPGAERTAEQTQNRLLDNYRGPGGYWQDLGRNIGHWGTRIGGAALGGLTGLAEGGIVGGAAGAVGGWETGADISRAMGWGTYEVPRVGNDLIGGRWAPPGSGSTPIYHSVEAIDESGDVIISNRELVQLIKASDTPKQFKIEKFTSNPADDTFTHLQQMSSQYEQFEFLGLMYQYIPMTGEGGSNELGIIGMVANYDPDQVKTFSSIEEMMQSKGALTHKPSIGSKFGIECDPDKRPVKTLYVRDDVNRLKSFTDVADFHIASQGVAAAGQTLGQLWVTYSCRFRNIKNSSVKEQNQVIHLLTNDSAVALEHAIGSKGQTWFDAWHDSSADGNDMHCRLSRVIGQKRTFKVVMYLKLDATNTQVSNPTLSPEGNGRIIRTNLRGATYCSATNSPINGSSIQGNFLSSGKANGEDDLMIMFYISVDAGAGPESGFKVNSAAFDYDGDMTIVITEAQYLDPAVTAELAPTVGNPPSAALEAAAVTL